jgi:hypothetical protein
VRRRPNIKVFLRPSIAVAGDEVAVDVVLTSKSQTPVDSVMLTLRGTEMVGNGKNFYQRRSLVAQRAAFGKATLEKGEARRSARFPIPHDAPPAYRGTFVVIDYELEVHVAIPWWLDRRDKFLIPVTRRSPDRAASLPRVFCNRQAPGAELYMEATVDEQRIEQDGAITGAVSFANVSSARIKRVELQFRQSESVMNAANGPPVWKLDAGTYVSTILDRAPHEGETVRFRVAMPKAAVMTFRTPYVALDWFVSIVAIVSFGTDVRIEVPLEVVAASSGRKRRVAALPPVGHERRVLLLRAAAQQLELDFTADNEELRTTLGSSTLVIRLEPHEGKGLVAVTELSWPALGLDLELRERRWTDAFGEELALDDKKFHKRFFVRASDPERASNLLDGEVRESFGTLTEVEIDDEGAVLARPISVQSVESVVEDLRPAVEAARRLADAAARIAPSFGYR